MRIVLGYFWLLYMTTGICYASLLPHLAFAY